MLIVTHDILFLGKYDIAFQYVLHDLVNMNMVKCWVQHPKIHYVLQIIN